MNRECWHEAPGPHFFQHRRQWGPHGYMRLEEEIHWLENYQRDLEQQLADVVERLRRLKQQGSTPPQGTTPA